MNLQTGAFGNPQNIETLIMFWEMMAGQHYPGASEVREKLEAQRQQQMAAQQKPQLPAELQAAGFAGQTSAGGNAADVGVVDGAGSAMQMMGGLNNGGSM